MERFEVDFEKVEEALNSSIISSFEEMSFIEVIAGGDSQLLEETLNTVKILIVKPFTATLLLRLPQSLGEKIAENIYCKSVSQLHKRDIADCSEELLNIVTGSFLTNYLGKGIKFKFEFPEMIYSPPQLEEGEKEMKRVYNAEGKIFEVTFILGEV